MERSFARLTVVLSGLCALTFAPLCAQSTFDGDITPAQHSATAVDVLTYVARPADGGWVWFYPRVYRGFAHDVEAGVGLSVYDHHERGGPSAIVPSLKWRAWQDTSRGLTVSTGGQALVALHRSADRYALLFSSVEQRLPATKYTNGAIAVGGYRLVSRTDCPTEDVGGAILSAWESAGDIRFTASWISGRNFYGYKTAGVTVPLARSQWLFVGYSQGNAALHNTGPYVSTGRTF